MTKWTLISQLADMETVMIGERCVEEREGGGGGGGKREREKEKGGGREKANETEERMDGEGDTL